MSTRLLRVDPKSPAADAMAQAAHVLQAGGLVVFPTETVYGLGANALDANAVVKIFAAKGRPATNPVIVHVAAIEDAKKLTTAWPALAQTLAERFWPGPLTLVLPKAACVPDIVTAGGSTVAIRIPAHPVALALLRNCRLPLAAPSANRSTELSPTRPEHVPPDLADLLLAAGPTMGGLESTVLDLTTDPPRLLRPGLVTGAELEAVIGPLDRRPHAPREESAAKSPGQMPRHYAPKTPLEVTAHSQERVEELCARGLKVGWLTYADEGTSPQRVGIVLPGDAASYSAGLYAALHQLDNTGLDRIVVEMPPTGDEWLAVHDRLRRAATSDEN